MSPSQLIRAYFPGKRLPGMEDSGWRFSRHRHGSTQPLIVSNPMGGLCCHHVFPATEIKPSGNYIKCIEGGTGFPKYWKHWEWLDKVLPPHWYRVRLSAAGRPGQHTLGEPFVPAKTSGPWVRRREDGAVDCLNPSLT